MNLPTAGERLWSGFRSIRRESRDYFPSVRWHQTRSGRRKHQWSALAPIVQTSGTQIVWYQSTKLLSCDANWPLLEQDDALYKISTRLSCAVSLFLYSFQSRLPFHRQPSTELWNKTWLMINFMWVKCWYSCMKFAASYFSVLCLQFYHRPKIQNFIKTCYVHQTSKGPRSSIPS